jgi:hypothetical protein
VTELNLEPVVSLRDKPVDPSLLSGVVPALDRGGEGAPRIGAATLDPAKVEAFNQVLLRVCPRARPLAAGQIAAAARRLLFTDARERGEGSIARRVARIQELERMRADSGFALDDGASSRIRELIDYVENADDLIPDDTPVIGQLDDAILIDLLLRELGPELADYADYCAFRREVAEREGLAPEAVQIDCADWIDARRREIEERRTERRGGYAPRDPVRAFRIS